MGTGLGSGLGVLGDQAESDEQVLDQMGGTYRRMGEVCPSLPPMGSGLEPKGAEEDTGREVVRLLEGLSAEGRLEEFVEGIVANSSPGVLNSLLSLLSPTSTEER